MKDEDNNSVFKYTIIKNENLHLQQSKIGERHSSSAQQEAVQVLRKSHLPDGLLTSRTFFTSLS